MFERLTVLQTSHDLAAHAAARQGVLSVNVANADTPGYRRRDLQPFAEVFARAAFTGTQQTLRPGHVFTGSMQAAVRPDPAAPSSPNGNSVSVEREMMHSVAARGQHDLALTVFRSLTGILRSSLGR